MTTIRVTASVTFEYDPADGLVTTPREGIEDVENYLLRASPSDFTITVETPGRKDSMSLHVEWMSDPSEVTGGWYHLRVGTQFVTEVLRVHVDDTVRVEVWRAGWVELVTFHLGRFVTARPAYADDLADGEGRRVAEDAASLAFQVLHGTRG